MKIRTVLTLAVIVAFVLAITGHFLPGTHTAADPMWKEVAELSAIMKRFCGGALWHVAAIGVLVWHLVGDLPGGGRGKGDH